MEVTLASPLLGCRPGDEVGTDPGAVPVLAKALQPVGKGSYLLLDLGIEAGQLAAVLFRPEEVHSRSTEAATLGSRVLARATEGPVGIAHYALRLCGD